MTNDDSSRRTIDDAYGFVALSYDWMLRRFEAVNGRLQNAIAVTATVPILAVPVIKALIPEVEFWSPPWLAGALVVFLVGMVLSVWALHQGDLTLMNLQFVHDSDLGKQPPDFKKAMLKTAARHLKMNGSVVRRKAGAAGAVLILLVLGAARFRLHSANMLLLEGPSGQSRCWQSLCER